MKIGLFGINMGHADAEQAVFLDDAEINQRADGAAFLHGGEAFVDFLQLDRV